MAFLEIRFPESISFNSASILEFNTSILETKSGLEQRNINWNKNKMKFNIINGIKTKEEIEEILTFFRIVRGRAYGFRFKDWSDYSTVSEQIGIGDGINKEFQLIKTYANNDNFYIRKITKPVIATTKLYVNNIQTTDFSIDLSTGIILMNTAPQNNDIITAGFEFDVPVRFDSDQLEISLNNLNSGNIKQIMLIETI